jgi:hypothetical protein
MPHFRSRKTSIVRPRLAGFHPCRALVTQQLGGTSVATAIPTLNAASEAFTKGRLKSWVTGYPRASGAELSWSNAYERL